MASWKYPIIALGLIVLQAFTGLNGEGFWLVSWDRGISIFETIVTDQARRSEVVNAIKISRFLI